MTILVPEWVIRWLVESILTLVIMISALASYAWYGVSPNGGWFEDFKEYLVVLAWPLALVVVVLFALEVLFG